MPHFERPPIRPPEQRECQVRRPGRELAGRRWRRSRRRRHDAQWLQLHGSGGGRRCARATAKERGERAARRARAAHAREPRGVKRPDVQEAGEAAVGGERESVAAEGDRADPCQRLSGCRPALQHTPQRLAEGVAKGTIVSIILLQ